MRTKVDSNIVQYKLEESQVSRLTAGDDWFEYIWRRAARLNCYGGAFAEMRERLGGLEPATDTDERRRLQAEIDAAAFHAYGLNREQTMFVLDDFHRMGNPPGDGRGVLRIGAGVLRRISRRRTTAVAEAGSVASASE